MKKINLLTTIFSLFLVGILQVNQMKHVNDSHQYVVQKRTLAESYVREGTLYWYDVTNLKGSKYRLLSKSYAENGKHITAAPTEGVWGEMVFQ